MPDLPPSLSSTALGPSAARQTNQAPSRLLPAALLSAALPGIGHFLMGRWRRGISLLVIFGAWLAIYCLLRLPQNIYGAILPILALAGLCVFAEWDVAYSDKRAVKPSQWWLLILLPT